MLPAVTADRSYTGHRDGGSQPPAPSTRRGATAGIHRQIHADTARTLDITPSTVDALFTDVWDEYLGSLNTDLVDYLTTLRPRHRTALLSNSFVGAREREQTRYGLVDLVDIVVYSHEEGICASRIRGSTCWRVIGSASSGVRRRRRGCVAGARAVGMHAIEHFDNRHTIVAIESHIACTG